MKTKLDFAAQQYCDLFTGHNSIYQVCDEEIFLKTEQTNDNYPVFIIPDRSSFTNHFQLQSFCKEFIKTHATLLNSRVAKTALKRKYESDIQHDIKNFQKSFESLKNTLQIHKQDDFIKLVDDFIVLGNEKFSRYESLNIGSEEVRNILLYLNQLKVKKLETDKKRIARIQECMISFPELNRLQVRATKASQIRANEKKIKILIVDDEFEEQQNYWRPKLEDRYIIQAALTEFDHVQVLDVLEKHKDIHILLLDIMDKNHHDSGIELFEKMKEQQAWKERRGAVQVIFFSQDATNYRHYKVSSFKKIEVAGFLEKEIDACFHARIKQANYRAERYQKFPSIAWLTQKILESTEHAMIYSPNSTEMEKVLEQVIMAGLCKEPVLIRGETGTGKEMIAQHIATVQKLCQGLPSEIDRPKWWPKAEQQLDEKKDSEGGAKQNVKPSTSHKKCPEVNDDKANGLTIFSCNIASLPVEGNLLQSELFGYKEGAYTGASDNSSGLFQKASDLKIPVFLDEIGDAPASVQTALLRVLQGKEVLPIGAEIPEKLVYLRLIAATNIDFESQIKSGDYRLDLYHRLSCIEIILPPLARRPHDIPVLVKYFLEDLNEKYERDIILSPSKEEAMFKKLNHYSWPGNIRELEQMIRSSYFGLMGGEFQLSERAEQKLKGTVDLLENSQSLTECIGEINTQQIKQLVEYLEVSSEKPTIIKEQIGRYYVEEICHYLEKNQGLTGRLTSEITKKYFSQDTVAVNNFRNHKKHDS